jgi:hypothetical protein
MSVSKNIHLNDWVVEECEIKKNSKKDVIA